MRRKATVRIHLQRREGKDDAFSFRIGQSLECLEEEPDVVHRTVDVLVRGQH